VGQTVALAVGGGRDGTTTLTFNGVALEAPVPQGTFLFTIPAGPELIRIGASADNYDAEPLDFIGAADPRRQIRG